VLRIHSQSRVRRTTFPSTRNLPNDLSCSCELWVDTKHTFLLVVFDIVDSNRAVYCSIICAHWGHARPILIFIIHKHLSKVFCTCSCVATKEKDVSCTIVGLVNTRIWIDFGGKLVVFHWVCLYSLLFILGNYHRTLHSKLSFVILRHNRTKCRRNSNIQPKRNKKDNQPPR
jgi:hypothetical protein